MKGLDGLLQKFNLLHKKEEILRIAVPAIRLVKESTDEEELPIGQSKFGGLPDLPSTISFPTYKNGDLTFLAQLNLQEVEVFDQKQLLPKKGFLYFFYDIEEQPWGFDTDDHDAYKVLYFDGDVNELKRTPYPKETEDYSPLPSYKINFEEIFTFPEEFDGGGFNEEESENYYEFRSSVVETNHENELSTYPMHYMLGEPYNIQNNVFEEIVYYDNKEKLDWYSKELNEASNQMVLLFQMDSDDDLNVMWGDAGIIYFCINKEDLKNQKFAQTKFILQCY
ncbi:YwqG family protein [Heyndrickxia sporothermodurans]